MKFTQLKTLGDLVLSLLKPSAPICGCMFLAAIYVVVLSPGLSPLLVSVLPCGAPSSTPQSLSVVLLTPSQKVSLGCVGKQVVPSWDKWSRTNYKLAWCIDHRTTRRPVAVIEARNRFHDTSIFMKPLTSVVHSLTVVHNPPQTPDDETQLWSPPTNININPLSSGNARTDTRTHRHAHAYIHTAFTTIAYTLCVCCSH